MFRSRIHSSIGQGVRAQHWLMVCGLALGAAQKVEARSAAGPFARFNSWWLNPASGTLGLTTGAQLCIDRDGNGSAESCYTNPAVPAGGATNARLSPTRQVLMLYGNTAACGGTSLVNFFDVSNPPNGLTPIDSACIPNGVNSGQIGFYDTGLCCDGLTDPACAGAFGLVCTDGMGNPLLGVSPQRIAYVADLGNGGRVQIYWFDLNAGTHATTFPGFNTALQLTRAQVSPYGDAALVHHDTDGTDSDYTAVDLCGGSRLGRSLSSNVGGALFNLPNPTATAAMIDNGGGNFEIRVTHPTLSGGMLDLPFTPCSGSPPPVTGACCRPNACTLETADDCAVIPGDWLGPDTTCGECPMSQLTVTVVGPGSVSSNPAGISCPADCSNDYPVGAMVTLTASASSGAQFVGWSGDCAGTTAMFGLTLDGDRSCTATFNSLANLSIVKQDNQDPVIAGTGFTYTIAVTNNGPSTATGVEVTDGLPGNLTFNAAASDPACEEAGNTVTCDLGNMTNGAARILTVAVTADPATRGQISNTATVSATTLDTVQANNSSTAQTQVNGLADLAVTKTAQPDPIAAGGRLTYEIEVHNAGPSSATLIELLDTLPAGVTTVGNPANPAVVSCAVGGGTLDVNESTVVSFAVMVNAGTPAGTILTNTVEVSAAENDPNLTNNVDSFASMVSGGAAGPAEIVFTKIADTNTPIPGGTGNFTSFPSLDVALSEGNVAFRGKGPGQDGVYTWINGTLAVVADVNTPIPGGTGNFGAPATGGFGGVSIDGTDVAFNGDDATIAQRGVYARVGGVLDVVADNSTFTFGAPFPFSTLGSPSLDDGRVSFWAFVPASPIFGGIYLGDSGGFSRIADQNTFAPGGGGRFSNFNANSQHRQGNVAFFASNSSFALGLYAFMGGALQVIANQNTLIPGGGGLINLFWQSMAFDGSNIVFVGDNAATTQPRIFARDCLGLSALADFNTAVPCGSGNFTRFLTLSIHGGNTAFFGMEGNRAGLYVDLGGKLIKVIRVLDVLDGKKVSTLFMWHEALHGDQLVFSARFTDGSEGVFLAQLSSSGVCHPYDIDADGDRDLQDQAALELCFSGAGSAHDAGCALFDADGDGDVDDDDFQVFAAGLTGPLAPLPVEACCLANGSMCLMVDPDECQYVHLGTVMAGADCANSPCVATMGACCFIEGCLLTSAQTCMNFQGTYFAGQTCNAVTCP